MSRNIILALILALASCATPVSTVTNTETIIIQPPVINLRAYNSTWQIVAEASVAASRALTTDQALAEYVEIYNASHTDDQLFLIEGEELIPIQEAPAVDAYIVDKVTHDIITEHRDYPREELIGNIDAWKADAMYAGGVLYLDQIPPAPIPVIDTRTPFEKYALYLVDPDGGIVYETHLEEADMIAGGFGTMENYFYIMLQCYNTDATQMGPDYKVISGQLYEVAP